MGTNFRQFVRRWSEGEKDKREEAEGLKEIKGGREKGGKEGEKEVERERKAQVPVDQGAQHETRHTESIEEKVGNSLECIGTGKFFLNRTPMA